MLVRDGALLAWRVPENAGPTTGFRIIGAHTDSPGFVLKPNPDLDTAGWQQLSTEVYGGPLLNSWLDRELGLAGRLIMDDGAQRLVRTGAIMRIPQLAIHLDRSVNDEGLKLDRQFQTRPVWGVGGGPDGILDHVAGLVGASAEDVLGVELVAFDTAAPAVFGPNGEFFASGRLDNLSSVHAGLDRADRPRRRRSRSRSWRPSITRRWAAVRGRARRARGWRSCCSGSRTALGGDAEAHFQALAASVCLSSDTGHAVHPNYVDRHDPSNRPLLNGGPLLKINANQRYATNAVGRGAVAAGLPSGWSRRLRSSCPPTTCPCGSTIGPLTATRLGVSTVDVGAPLLSMHSVRELAGTQDLPDLAAAMTAFLVMEDQAQRPKLAPRGSHHRHRRTAQRRQVDAVQRAHPQRRPRGELSVRDHRAERRGGRRARSAARRAGAHRSTRSGPCRPP